MVPLELKGQLLVETERDGRVTTDYVSFDQLQAMLESAWNKAIVDSAEFILDDPYVVNGDKCSMFIHRLAQQFEDHYANNSRLRVWQSSNSFEFPHDITVSEVESVGGPIYTRFGSPNEESTFDRISNVLWQIQLNMTNSGRLFVHDLNKLGSGTSQSDKLFVVRDSWSNHLPWLKDQILHVAKLMRGRLFLALLPDPKYWNMSIQTINLMSYRSQADCDNMVYESTLDSCEELCADE